jgi:hypothetical protein
MSKMLGELQKVATSSPEALCPYFTLSNETLFLPELTLSPATFLPSSNILSDFLICANTKG